MPWFLYIIKCRDESLYTGITTDISRRINEHNSKKGAFYTQNKTPVKLVYQETLTNQSEARKREAAIKKLTRKQKLELVDMLGTQTYRHPNIKDCWVSHYCGAPDAKGCVGVPLVRDVPPPAGK